MKWHILVTTPIRDKHKKFLNECVEKAGEEAEFSYVLQKDLTEDDLAAADIILGGFPPARVKEAKKVRWVQLDWAGAEHFAAPGVLAEDVQLTNVSGAYGLAVSEHMLAQTLVLIRHFAQYRDNQKAHLWRPEGDIISIEDSVILILGMGDIGRDYARKVKAMGAYTIGMRRTDREKPEYFDEQYTIDHLDEILPRADIVAMILPGGASTTHIMDERRMRLMKKGAYILNCGRGTAIDPEGLAKVLTDGHLAGAAIDVVEQEPLAEDSPLWDLPGMFITPHVAGNFYLPQTVDRLIAIEGDNLTRFLTGQPLTHVVDRKLGY